MARTKTNSLPRLLSGDFNWQDSYLTLVVGAIIVIVLGLLVANYFTTKNQQIAGGQQTSAQKQAETQTSQEYKVQEGDSLSAISQKYYETYNFWPVLARVNNIANPDLIYKDTTLKIPSKAEVEKIHQEMTITSYQVQEGDTLFLIAKKVYGDGSKWPLLDEANHVARLPNGNPLIFAGNTLVIPR